MVEFDKEGRSHYIEEKPNQPKSRYGVDGLYFYDANMIVIVRGVKPSTIGELEISDVNRIYRKQADLKV